jgi:hypothetical protein
LCGKIKYETAWHFSFQGRIINKLSLRTELSSKFKKKHKPKDYKERGDFLKSASADIYKRPICRLIRFAGHRGHNAAAPSRVEWQTLFIAPAAAATAVLLEKRGNRRFNF